MSLNLTDKSKIQIYVNEFIGHNVINRSLMRLYDNDLIIYNSVRNDIAVTSGILESEIDALDVRVAANEAQLASLDLSGLNTTVQAGSANWNWTYNTVNDNYLDWNNVYSHVNATSGTWGIGSDTLSGLNDVSYIPSLLNTGDRLEWNAGSNAWVIGSAGTSGVTAGEVSGIVEAYDTENGWTATAQSQSVMLQFTTEMSGYPLSAYNAELRNTLYVEEDLAGTKDFTVGHSMWDPYRSIGQAFGDEAAYPWSTQTDFIQKRYININQNLNIGEASIEDNFVTVSGATDVYNQMHIVATKADESPNIPGENILSAYLPAVSGNTFKIDGPDDIEKSWFMFKGLAFNEANIFSGSITDAKYFFTDCYIDLDEVTVSTPSQFIFDNSCTINPGTNVLSDLTIKNAGIPTYTTSPDSSNYSDIQGAYTVEGTGEFVVHGQIYSALPATHTPSTSAQNIDWNDGNGQIIDLDSAPSGGVTLTFSNPQDGASYLLKFCQATAAPFIDVTLPSEVLLPGGGAPHTLNITPVSGSIDTLTIFYDGTNYLGQYGQAYG